DGGTYTVTGDIGRSLQKVPGRHAITFVHRFTDDEWWVRELDLDTRSIRSVAPLLGPDDYHAWLP
ncbi:MAG: hypothetical protein GWN71_36285, partial [Gammaproteobacteria bacterium]|nr:hypothetical protein [Gemmatimonadota bacterium]NIU78816.1 hypothetical protein [Gammaproteobacteria bacterium]